jgi:hypothetical protein
MYLFIINKALLFLLLNIGKLFIKSKYNTNNNIFRYLIGYRNSYN